MTKTDRIHHFEPIARKPLHTITQFYTLITMPDGSCRRCHITVDGNFLTHTYRALSEAAMTEARRRFPDASTIRQF